MSRAPPLTPVNINRYVALFFIEKKNQAPVTLRDPPWPPRLPPIPVGDNSVGSALRLDFPCYHCCQPSDAYMGFDPRHTRTEPVAASYQVSPVNGKHRLGLERVGRKIPLARCVSAEGPYCRHG